MSNIGLLVVGGLALWLLFGSKARATTAQPSLGRVPPELRQITKAPDATFYQPPTVRQEALKPFFLKTDEIPPGIPPNELSAFLPAPVNTVSVVPFSSERIIQELTQQAAHPEWDY